MFCFGLPWLSHAADDPPKEKPKGRTGEKWAILIAVDDYLNASDLKFCGADQRAMKERLIKSGFDERQVYLLHDEATDKKLLPFKANIERQLQTVLSFAEKGDFVLVAFSGHGVHLDKISYLCPTDAKLDDPNSLISMDWVYDRLTQSKADLRLVMVDACRNDPRPPGQRALSNAEVRAGTRAFVETTDKRLPEGILLLNSCSEGEVSQEDEKFGHGVFMHFVLEGLAGQADKDGDKKVTFNELVRYTSKETKLFVEKRYNDSQRPKLKGNLTGDVLDFELASLSVPRRPDPPKPLPANAPKTLTNSIAMKFTLIPAGEFEMGDEIQSPVHRVRISQPFYLGVYEVTQAQYEQVMGTSPSWFSKTGDGKGKVLGLDTKDCPVEQVSWHDAQEFCQKLSARNSESVRRYRLPTEAEWEYACRAGTKTKFHFGDVLNGDRANVNGNSPEGTTTKGPNLEHTTSVGRYSANAFGLYDMHGNVFEWSEDNVDSAAYSKRSSLTIDPLITNNANHHFSRGGSWDLAAVNALSAHRFSSHATMRHTNIGFRVVFVPSP